MGLQCNRARDHGRAEQALLCRLRSGSAWRNAWTGAEGNTIKKPNAQWIKPSLVGHIRFLKGEGGLRHATLTEVRED
jgi:hypothetical protein